MKKIDKDISDGQLKQMYLLYGDEAFLKKRYRNKLRDAFLPDGDTLNLSYFEGAGTSVRDIIDTAETLPFLSERRLIIVENSGFFKTSKPELADYLKQAPETAAFIFVENEADKRGKLYKAVAAGGYAVEISAQTTDTLTKWVAVTLRNEGKTTDRRTVEYFIGKCGSDMFLGLRLIKGVSEAEFARRFGASLNSVYGGVIATYEKSGFLCRREGRLCLSEAGIAVSNRILSDFLLDSEPL